MELSQHFSLQFLLLVLLELPLLESGLTVSLRVSATLSEVRGSPWRFPATTVMELAASSHWHWVRRRLVPLFILLIVMITTMPMEVASSASLSSSLIVITIPSSGITTTAATLIIVSSAIAIMGIASVRVIAASSSSLVETLRSLEAECFSIFSSISSSLLMATATHIV